MRTILATVCLGFLAGSLGAQDAAPPRSGTRPPRDEVFKMLDAYIVSNLQESLALTDEQFVKILPLVKRVQTGRREYAQKRSSLIAEMNRLFESGGATETRIGELMADVKALESEGPAKLRKDVDALDSMLTPVQQAKLRVLETQVEHRIRELMAGIRSQSAGGRGRDALPRRQQRDDEPDSPKPEVDRPPSE